MARGFRRVTLDLMFQNIVTNVLIGTPIEIRIRDSHALSEKEKLGFLNLIAYFTPTEIRDLEALL